MNGAPVPNIGTILSVWAHPDDESYCCAGLMAVAARAGNRVVCVTATRGELGSTDTERWPNGPTLADVRTKELAACLAEIGVTEHTWLDYPDGGTYHPDHISVSNWTTEAVRDTGAQLHYASITPRWQETLTEFIDPTLVMMTDDEPLVSPVDTLSIYALLDAELLDMKYRAMMCQESQIGPLLSLMGEQRYREMLSEETFRDGRLRPWG